MSDQAEQKSEGNKLGFSQIPNYDVGLAVKLQIRWLCQPEKGPKHLMPFLSRTLSYVRQASRETLAPIVKKKRVRRLDKKRAEPNPKQLNLLFDLFKHRTALYNDALLDTPRRETRQLVRADVKSGTPTKAKKRKREDSIDNDQSTDAVQGLHKRNQTWEEKLAANDKSNKNGILQEKQPRSELPAPMLNAVAISPKQCSVDDFPSMPFAGNGVYLSSTASARTSMFIHYLFLGENGLPAVHVEERHDRRCPFCFHDAVSDTGIVLHLSASHGDTYTFESARSEVGQLHITASFRQSRPVVMEGKERLNDFVFVAPSARSLPIIPFVQRCARKVASQDVMTRARSVRLLEEMGADESRTKSFNPDDKTPVRQYFHSKTYQPMVGGDWDVDSDEDSTTDQWRKDATSALLDDFTDLGPDEKKFMKLWNQFAHSNTVVADKCVPDRCMAFIRQHAVKLKALNLRQELSLHLHNLWDAGVISSDQIVKCMQEFDSTVGEWVYV